MSSPEFLRELQAQYARAQREAIGALERARDTGRSGLTDIERRRVDDVAALKRHIDEVREDVERVGYGNPTVARLRTITEPEGRPTVSTYVNEPTIYRKGGQYSYLRDLIRVHQQLDTNGDSRSRLMRHAEEIGETESRAISRVDGAGGYAVPPAWLMEQYVELARPGRPFANLVQRQPLPGGTDSINVPKLLTGAAVGVQTADNTAVANVDLTDTFINAPVRTIAGEQNVAIQLIDQSPIAFDEVVFGDLTAAHASVLDQQVLYGSGTNGQVLGVAGTPGITTIPVSTLDIKGIYSGLANAIQTINTSRFLPPTVIVMHPRRWSWLLTLLDANNRPLFIPTANGAFNAAGILTDVDSQQVVGQVHGLPVVTDPNITITGGAGADEDVIYILRASDVVLWEGGVRARVLPEVLSHTLTVVLQVFSYLAFSAGRYPQSIVELTGLTPPTF